MTYANTVEATKVFVPIVLLIGIVLRAAVQALEGQLTPWPSRGFIGEEKRP